MKCETLKKANKIKKQEIEKGKNVSVYKFANKRKFQFFVGNWWEWLAVIS